MTKIQVAVIGLGKFGFGFAKALVDLGHDVIGIDTNHEHIHRAQDILPHVYEADAMDQKALEQLGVADMNHVVVSVGESIEASSIISLHLKEMGVDNVWVKAVSAEHERLLRRIGVEEVIFPEQLAAEQLAYKLAVPGLLAFLPFEEDVAVREVTIQRWAGKSLRDLNLTNVYGAQVIAKKAQSSPRYSFVPRADDPLEEGDTLVVIGRTDTISSWKA